MIEAEKSFAAYAGSDGVQQAFMKFLDDSAKVFEKGTIALGKEVWKDRKTDSLGLAWYPEFGEVSASGDLGYTTGPWQLRMKRSNEKPDATGYFNTIWKKDRSGEWKALIDIGTASEFAEYDEGKVDYINKEATLKKAGKRKQAKKADTADIKNIEDTFIANYAEGKGYMKYASKAARYIRPGKPVMKGSIEGDTSKFVYRYAGGDVAASHDLGYSYGSLEASGKQGNYLRVWKKEGDEWRIVLDVASY